MDIRFALKRQYRAGLAQLRECVEKAPEDIWLGGQHPRNFWRIAYHAVFYTHFYMVQSEEAFVPWDKHRESATTLWASANPPVIDPYTKEEVLDYISLISASVELTIDHLDLDAEETGFPWYRDMSKLEHEIMTIRHIQGHVGQLSEILMSHGIDSEYWISRS